MSFTCDFGNIWPSATADELLGTAFLEQTSHWQNEDPESWRWHSVSGVTPTATIAEVKSPALQLGEMSSGPIQSAEHDNSQYPGPAVMDHFYYLATTPHAIRMPPSSYIFMSNQEAQANEQIQRPTHELSPDQISEPTLTTGREQPAEEGGSQRSSTKNRGVVVTQRASRRSGPYVRPSATKAGKASTSRACWRCRRYKKPVCLSDRATCYRTS